MPSGHQIHLIVWNLRQWVIDWFPKLHSVTCEGLMRGQSEPRLRAGLSQVFDRVASDLLDIVKARPELEKALAGLSQIFPDVRRYLNRKRTTN